MAGIPWNEGQAAVFVVCRLIETRRRHGGGVPGTVGGVLFVFFI